MKISGTPRARTREDVRQIFARTPEAPQRTCPHCGAQTQTREEHCPACGRSYFERPDRFSPRTPLGRYACEAAVETASNGGITSTLGVPFVGTINFPKGRLTWCKDNPTSASDIKSALAFVRLARECTAARGPVFGSGYLIEPRR